LRLQVVLQLNAFKVRLSLISDLPALSVIEDASFPVPYPPSLLERLMRDCPATFLVATQESGELVGYCVSSMRRKSAHLISVAVRSSFRREGIATMLLRRTIDFLVGEEVVDFWLEVNPSNTGAIALYAKMGFEKMGTVKSYYSDGADAIRMRLVISS
jgi:ribosomal-protein-alanine N-acetyltransferase